MRAALYLRVSTTDQTNTSREAASAPLYRVGALSF
jgi:DNA invertase Pin-like site-specific DNA recombinase